MPILEISALKPARDVDVPAALTQVNMAIATAYGCDLQHVWSTVTWLEPGHYVQGSLAADIQPSETHKPIGRLTCFEGKSPDEIEVVLLAASRAMSDAFGLGDNVFLTYVEAKSGQVAAANRIERK